MSCQIVTPRDPRATQLAVPSTVMGDDPRARVGAVGRDSRRRLGQEGEQLAAEHMSRRGFEILERNYQTRWGELDIVAFDGYTLAFCEVKTRRLGPRAGHPFDALRTVKRDRVRNMARSWLAARRDHPYARVLRFDAIGVTFDLAGQLVSIEHLEGAF
jgi:putative endonuclease